MADRGLYRNKYSRIWPGLFAGLTPALVFACSLGFRQPVQEEVPVLRSAGQSVQEEAPVSRSAGQSVQEEVPVLRSAGQSVQEEAPVSQEAGQKEGTVLQDDTGSEQAPQIALTFDDGPHSVYTPRLLDGLKERGVLATFFVLGENIEGNEALLERMSQEGHLIGNHTYHHVKLNSLQHDTAISEIQKTSALVEAVTGQGTEFIRPPFGIWNKTLEYDVTMLPALWDIDTLDWTTKNVPVTVGKVMDGAADQDIILFHDCYASSVEAALRAVDLLLEQGYEFVTVDQIILAP